MITLEQVSKSYATEAGPLVVLQQADLGLERGELSTIAGPSGSGKSTILHLLGGIDTPDTGQVWIGGVNVASLSDSAAAMLRNRTIGFIFQSFHLIPVLTAAENVAYPLVLRGVPLPQRRQRARDLLSRVGLGEFVNQRPNRLSGGQRQRVAIARSLACEPLIVLADEPTANLDRDTARDIMELLSRLNRQDGVTFLIATHDPMVEAFARRKLRIEHGKIVEHSMI
ncbi:ABC transporter ATP-binding protein YtrE [Candidatus Entotheonellaceae bacterium PAL068K]